MVDEETAQLIHDLKLRVDDLEQRAAFKIEFRNVAPLKPREGMIYGADGTNWNPGDGQGVYVYYGGSWTKLSEVVTSLLGLNNTWTGDNDFSGGDVTLANILGAVAFYLQGATTHATNRIAVNIEDPTAARDLDIPDKDLDLGKIINTPDVDASVASNELTVDLNPCVLAFRSATLTDGSPTVLDIRSALTMDVPSGATLGTLSGEPARLAIVVFNDAGTARIGIINIDGGTYIGEAGVASSTAISAAADTKGVFYTETAVTSKAYRVVGIIDIEEATAGTWATAPTLVQASFGNAATAMDSIGYGQKWTDVGGSRSAATDYYNDTGRPIEVRIVSDWQPNGTIDFLVDGSIIDKSRSSTANHNTDGVGAIVPPGSVYRCNVSVYAIAEWWELR